MPRARRLTCLVCGRVFPEGQGVKLVVAGRELVFHSKTCTVRFVRSLLERVERTALERALKEVLEEYEKLAEERRKRAEKKI